MLTVIGDYVKQYNLCITWLWPLIIYPKWAFTSRKNEYGTGILWNGGCHYQEEFHHKEYRSSSRGVSLCVTSIWWGGKKQAKIACEWELFPALTGFSWISAPLNLAIICRWTYMPLLDTLHLEMWILISAPQWLAQESKELIKYQSDDSWKCEKSTFTTKSVAPPPNLVQKYSCKTIYSLLLLVYWRSPGHSQSPHKKGTRMQYGIFILVLHVCTYLCTLLHGHLEFPRGMTAESNFLRKVTQCNEWKATCEKRCVLQKYILEWGFFCKKKYSDRLQQNCTESFLLFCLFVFKLR